MYTLEIDGRAVAVINGDEETARDLFTCDGFKDDIRAMTSEGRPLWNATAALTVRPASDAEVEEFEDALSEDDEEGEFEPDPHHTESPGAGQVGSRGTETQGVEDDEDEADIVFLVDIDEGSGHLDA